MSSAFLGTSPVAAEPGDSCSVTIEVKSCSGAAKADLTVAIEVGNDSIALQTDEDGKVVFEQCAEEIDEVLVYLMEDAPPMSSSPVFEADPESPLDSRAIVVVC